MGAEGGTMMPLAVVAGLVVFVVAWPIGRMVRVTLRTVVLDEK
jgi:hypothetical protein